MLIWADGQSGTIGGGALELDASHKARAMLAGGTARTEKIALGPSLGQCCGGAVTLGYERFDQTSLAAIPQTGLFARPVSAQASAESPLAIRRAEKAARGEGVVSTRYAQGWLAEPLSPPARPVWIWGAGHVGRALVSVLAPLPGLSLTWIDTAEARFPDSTPPGVTRRIAEAPQTILPEAPKDAEHYILTFSHALDLDLCHRALSHGFAACGLIGSASKWARFRTRLQALGHDPRDISRIVCPIGDPAFGKHPQAIAVSVAAAILAQPFRVSVKETAR